ncbi:MAG: hypothetical protein QGG88_01130 [Gammaproteobacteria bacterium]|jgi:hypothetical protein|nr:hypothetical protein [Gammaproteobacteria bacterium]
MANNNSGPDKPASLLMWVVAIGASLLLFYGLDQLIMASQGLPLNLDLTPAQ